MNLLLKKRSQHLILFILSLTCNIVLAQNIDTLEEKNEIRKIVEAFETGMKEKDSTKLISLFIWEQVPIFGPMNGDSLPTINSILHAADFSKRFIHQICGSSDLIEEEFSNIDIEVSDGIASMDAEFISKRNNKVSNSGKEMWHLLKTVEGWKITSIIWTNNDLK